MKPLQHLTLAFLLSLPLPTGAAALSDAQSAIRSEVHAFLERQAAQNPGQIRVDISDTAIPRNAKPCGAIQVSLPGGQRAWGQTTVAVRCTAPMWTLYVPARVVIEGDYLIAARPLAAGATLNTPDWEVRHGDIASQPPGVLTHVDQARGRTLRQAVSGGVALRSSQLLVVHAVERGQRVRVLSGGEGFEVANEGIAQTPAADGQPVQVKLDSGRVVQGIARSDGRVEIRQ